MSKKILIVGAGITGLSLASLLDSDDIDVTIIDTMPNMTRQGYGITIMPLGMAVIEKLGLKTKLKKLGRSAKNCQAIDLQGNILTTLDFAATGTEAITLNRGELHHLLVSRLKQTRVKVGMSVTSLKQDGDQVIATFTNHKKARFDLVVGCDGIHSVVRSLIFPRFVANRIGAAIWTLMTPDSYTVNDPQTVKTVWGNKQFMGIFPAKTGAAVTFSMPLPATVRPSTVDIKAAFSHLSPQSRAILQQVDPADVYSSHVGQIKLKHWYKGSIILAGDAAHAMMPATGMGASIGLQDSLALSELIRETPVKELHTVPKLYEKKRKHQAEHTQLQAYIVGRMMLSHGVFARLRNAVLAILPQKMIIKGLAKKPVRLVSS